MKKKLSKNALMEKVARRIVQNKRSQKRAEALEKKAFLAFLKKRKALPTVLKNTKIRHSIDPYSKACNDVKRLEELLPQYNGHKFQERVQKALREALESRATSFVGPSKK